MNTSPKASRRIKRNRRQDTDKVTASTDGPHRPIQVVYRAISKLTLDPHNPRSHDKKQIDQIALSIRAFGFNVPVLIDSKNKVIAGHGRLLACRRLGITKIPTVCLNHLNKHQARAFMIADNRLTENAEWDDHLLAEQLKELSLANIDFDLEITGFEAGEIDLLIEGLSPVAEGKADPADALPEPSEGKHVSQAGDLWYLGPHRVYCGSALDEIAYTALIADKRVAMVFTDPPYNIPIDGNVTGFGSIHHREFAMGAGEMDEAEFTAFLSKACQLMARYTLDGSLHFIFMDWRHMASLLTAGMPVYTELKNLCVWAKESGGMGSFYRSQHELVFVFKNGKAPHRNHIQMGQFGRSRGNLWAYNRVTAFGRATEEGKLLDLHPTVKPVTLVADALLDCSARGEIVLDPFLGSGTTVIAAERMGRICYGIEIDPIYVDTAIRRWQAYTGLTALHAQSKQSFGALEAERRSNHG